MAGSIDKRIFGCPAIIFYQKKKLQINLVPGLIVMKEDPTMIDNLFQKITEFSKTYFELLKLKTADKVTEAVSSAFPDLVIICLTVIFLLFVNIAAALWLGDLFGKVYLGFLIVAGFYFILGFISHFFVRSWFKKIASNYIIKQFFR